MLPFPVEKTSIFLRLPLLLEVFDVSLLLALRGDALHATDVLGRAGDRCTWQGRRQMYLAGQARTYAMTSVVNVGI